MRSMQCVEVIWGVPEELDTLVHPRCVLRVCGTRVLLYETSHGIKGVAHHP